MEIFVVTSRTEEKDTNGVILSVKVRFHGVFSNRVIADGIASKYKGTVNVDYLDRENGGEIIQYWVNPGFKQ